MESFSLLSCRMCLRIPEDGALTFSVSDTFKGQQLHELIGQLFGIKISKEDFLTNVCVDCMDRINTVRTIHQHFLQNNEKLKQLLETFREDSEDVEVLVIDEIHLLNERESHKPADVNTDVCFMKSEPEPSPISSPSVEEDKEVKPAGEVEIEFIQNPPVDFDDEEPIDHNLLIDVINSSVPENEVFDSNPGVPVPDNTSNEVKIEQSIKSKSPTRKAQTDCPILTYKCYFCKAIFQRELDFTDHLHLHFEEVPLVCEKCDNIVIKSVRQASKHLALHDEEERPHKCRICELRFFTRENSLAHERKIHRMKVKIKENIDGYGDKQKLKTFRCKICGHSAANYQRMKKHEVTHGLSPTIHPCEVCGKQFTARKNLTRHLMIHTGELPYKCEFCDRAFRQAGDLKDHIRSHTKEKPYECNSCGMRFRNVSMLHVHRKKRHCTSDE